MSDTSDFNGVNRDSCSFPLCIRKHGLNFFIKSIFNRCLLFIFGILPRVDIPWST